jgi:hypothetical protein
MDINDTACVMGPKALDQDVATVFLDAVAK